MVGIPNKSSDEAGKGTEAHKVLREGSLYPYKHPEVENTDVGWGRTA